MDSLRQPAVSTSTAPAQDFDVDALAREFAAFQKGRAPGARVPNSLRLGALAAYRAGVMPGVLRKRCGVNTSQLAQWVQWANRTTDDELALQEELPVRVFDVEDVDPAATSQAAPLRPLTFSVGGWHISITPADSSARS